MKYSIIRSSSGQIGRRKGGGGKPTLGVHLTSPLSPSPVQTPRLHPCTFVQEKRSAIKIRSGVLCESKINYSLKCFFILINFPLLFRVSGFSQRYCFRFANKKYHVLCGILQDKKCLASWYEYKMHIL